MEKLTVIGLDLAKNVFQVHGMDDRGRMVLGVKLKRSQVLEYFAKLPRARIGMETCCGAHEWARRLQDLGHDVKLMAPRHVKPYLHGNKTDARDALAIAEAAARDSVPSVAIRSVAGQQIQALHRARELWMKQRIALSNQIRGLLAEFGEVMPQGMRTLLGKAVHTVEAVKNGLKNAETGRENQALALAVSATAAAALSLNRDHVRHWLNRFCNVESSPADQRPGRLVIVAIAGLDNCNAQRPAPAREARSYAYTRAPAPITTTSKASLQLRAASTGCAIACRTFACTFNPPD